MTQPLDTLGVRRRWSVFVTQCALLMRRMFDLGLPLRGTIDTGNFVVMGTCLPDGYRERVSDT